MAIFPKKTNTDEPKAAKPKAVKAAPAVKKAPKAKAVKTVALAPSATTPTGALSPLVLKNPRITEKATVQAENGVYTFNVYLNANKQDVMDAIFELAIKSKKVFSRNKRGSKGGGKKAYVYLAKGDKIEFV
jgi:large subunit ribosomal protein L23